MIGCEIICPVCAGDVVRWASVKRVGGAFLVCRGCESAWLAQDDVARSPPLSVSSYLARIGVPDDWFNIQCRAALRREL